MLSEIIHRSWEKNPVVDIYRRIRLETEDKSLKRKPNEGFDRIRRSKEHIFSFIQLLTDNLSLVDNSEKQYFKKIHKFNDIMNNEGNEMFKINIYDMIPTLFDDYGDPTTKNKYGKNRIEITKLEEDNRIKEILNGI